jgi:hypothetical protein
LQQLSEPRPQSVSLFGARCECYRTLRRNPGLWNVTGKIQRFRLDYPGQGLLCRSQGRRYNSACAFGLTHGEIVFAKKVSRHEHWCGSFVGVVLEFEVERGLEMSAGVGRPLHARKEASVLPMDVWRSVVARVGDGQRLAIPGLGLRKATGLPEVGGFNGQA